MEEYADARGEVGVWQHDDDDDLGIYDQISLIRYFDKYGYGATVDHLCDWSNIDLADFILHLANLT